MSYLPPDVQHKLTQANTQTIATSFVVIAIVYHIGSKIYDVYFGPLSKFPGPKSHAFSIIPSILATVTGQDNKHSRALHEKYGPIVRTGPTTLSFANGAESFKDIYGFKKSGQAGLYKDPAFYNLPVNKVASLFEADDTGHSRMRKILSHAFSDRALKEQEPLFQRWVDLLLQKLQERAVAADNKVDILKFYNCTTFDIMGDLTFAEGLNMLDGSEYSPWVKTIFDSIKTLTFFRAMNTYSNLVNYILEEQVTKMKFLRKKVIEHWSYSVERVDRRLAKTPDRPDLWTKILEKSDGLAGLSLGEHHSTASFFMVAGTETTATALSGTTYHLLRNPEMLARLSSELRSDPECLTLEKLAKNKYLMAVLQEGLRMYPPVPLSLPRKVPKGGAVICGEWLPEGVRVGVHHFTTYRNNNLFYKPDEFHPERWLGDPEFKNDKLDSLEPFSYGSRNCLGKNLAWHEMRLILASVLVHFDIKICDESNNWDDQKVFILWEKKPLICTITPVKA